MCSLCHSNTIAPDVDSRRRVHREVPQEPQAYQTHVPAQESPEPLEPLLTPVNTQG